MVWPEPDHLSRNGGERGTMKIATRPCPTSFEEGWRVKKCVTFTYHRSGSRLSFGGSYLLYSRYYTPKRGEITGEGV